MNCGRVCVRAGSNFISISISINTYVRRARSFLELELDVMENCINYVDIQGDGTALIRYSRKYTECHSVNVCNWTGVVG